MTVVVSGKSLASIDRSSPQYLLLQAAHQRIAVKDSQTWGVAASAEAAIRLNWIDLPEVSHNLKDAIEKLQEKFQGKDRLILCGMGGSSLAPEVLAKTFKRDIFIVDSTDPQYLQSAIADGLGDSLIIVSSKSGSTIETSSQRAFFEQSLITAGLKPQDHMLFITDPDSPLDQEVRSLDYAVINADPHVGGRFSALSAFGVVPAALAGIDIWTILEDASGAKKDFLADDKNIIDVAYLLSHTAGQYLATTDEGSGFPGLSDWLEQLIAESTGKDGRGRLPIVTEDFSSAANGDVFTLTFGKSKSTVQSDLEVVAPLSAHFIFWEWVTALLGVALEIDPFNQPDVTEAKEQTLTLLNEWRINDRTVAPALVPDSYDGVVEIFGAHLDLEGLLRKVISDTPVGGYIAIMAYLDRASDRRLEKLRHILAEKSGRPTTFGWGPRFLHSTGQFHKAGQPNGSFLQITAENDLDVEIPGKDYSFATLIAAQALGDGRALVNRKYPLTRIHCKERSAGIDQILAIAIKL